MFGKSLWTKLAVVAVSSGTALALFGGAAVHTQFSATSNQAVTADGASVALTVDNGTFTCSNLLPDGATPVLAASCWSANAPVYGINLNNTGSVSEDFFITFGTIKVNNGGVDGDVLANLDQAYIWAGWGAGAVIGSGNAWNSTWGPVPLTNYFVNGTGVPIGGPYAIGSVAAGQSDHGSMTLSLVDPTGIYAPPLHLFDPNAWNGASITIPYTITAEAGV
jgi:hypothetical protein